MPLHFQNETDEAMVFSTADTSIYGTGGTGREERNHQLMDTSSSIGGNEEAKSSSRGKFYRLNRHDPYQSPEEYLPPELGRPSLSESMGAKSK